MTEYSAFAPKEMLVIFCQKCKTFKFGRDTYKGKSHRFICLKENCPNPVMCAKCWIRHGHNRDSQKRRKIKKEKVISLGSGAAKVIPDPPKKITESELWGR